MSINRKKIAIVHVLYPPKALGGATRVVVDEIDTITTKYGDDFEVVVFAADIERQPAYQLDVYPYHNYRVYSVSCTATALSNWHHKDDRVAEIFEQFLEFENPDLIHFHCVQILTASILEIAKKKGIPYFVSVHDAWWISDYQFLYDKAGKIYSDGHPDPFAKIELPPGIGLEQSLTRKAYLKRRLNDAVSVLPVSETYKKIYEKNGINNLMTVTNGISSKIDWLRKDTSSTEKLICGHVGGISNHKGFWIFKEAVSELKSDKIEVIVVDHTKNGSYSLKTRWGSTLVNIIGHVDQKDIAKLYGQIDVLFAPSTAPESYGLVSREAAACGCWVVASDVGAIGEDINDESGFRISPTKDSILAILKKLEHDVQKYKEPASPASPRYSEQQTAELVKIFRSI